MEIKTLLSSLYQKLRLGIKPGLERTIELANYLNNPQNNYKTIHIAGTNGKGACSSIASSILIEMGYKVGLYTSPHFFDFNERIRVNGKMISDSEIINIYKKLEPKANETEATFFEITTLLAFEYFAQEKVDYAIIETGMGGRFDSTNIIDPELSIISSIGMDHSEFLGDTIDKIAFEKAGIIKKQKPIFASALIPEIARNVIKENAASNNSDYFFIDPNSIFKDIKYNTDLSTTLSYKDQIIKFGLPGNNQLSNLALVLSGLELLKLDRDKINPALNNLYNNTNYFGRMQVLNNNPDIIIDISHNEDAIQNIIDSFSLHNYKKPIDVLFTCMKEKNYKLILDRLSNLFGTIYLTRSNNPRNIDINLLEDYCIKKKINYIKYENCNEAFDEILSKKKNFLITGSFFLIEELKNKLNSFLELSA